MKAYVAVTDNDWYRFLRARPELDEVNFWQPGGKHTFRALAVGQPFLFKLHAPENFIVGGGFFTHFSLVPSSLAWEAFGEKNGAGSLEEMRQRIEKYRRSQANFHEDYTIGCIILQMPFFFEERDWISCPKDFHPNIVQGKRYDLDSPLGRGLWKEVELRLQRLRTEFSHSAMNEEQSVYGNIVRVRQRLGQGAFRLLVTDTYQRRCAVTREKVLPVLDAAHIRPVSCGGVHRIDNGLLLRKDVHTLFDQGYITVTTDYQVRVSDKLKRDFHNGEHYYQFQKNMLNLPLREQDRPNREFLEWHSDTVFHG